MSILNTFVVRIVLQELYRQTSAHQCKAEARRQGKRAA